MTEHLKEVTKSSESGVFGLGTVIISLQVSDKCVQIGVMHVQLLLVMDPNYIVYRAKSCMCVVQSFLSLKMNLVNSAINVVVI